MYIIHVYIHTDKHTHKINPFPTIYTYIKSFINIGITSNSEHAAIANLERKFFGLQFHPEVRDCLNLGWIYVVKGVVYFGGILCMYIAHHTLTHPSSHQPNPPTM
jgi:hypothetical protein